MKKAIKKKKGLSAPSTMFGKKPKLPIKGKKKKSEVEGYLDIISKSPKTTKRKAKTVEKTEGEKRVDKIVDKMKAKKKPLPAIGKLPSKKDEIVEKTIKQHRKSFAGWSSAPCFGDDIIVPDAQGFDGHSDLVTFAGLDRVTKKALNGSGRVGAKNEKAFLEVEKQTIRNLWRWSNWIERIWYVTQNAEIPTKRLVVIPFDHVVPFDDVDLMIERLRSNNDFKQVMSGLGHKRYKVRIIPKIESDVKIKTLNWMNDLMSMHTGMKTIQGFYLPNMDIEDIPREIAFGAIPHQRKLSNVERFIDDLIDTKKRAVIQYETIRLLGSKISEIKETAIYQKLKRSWGLQNPLIEVTTAMSESKVRKLSRLGDIIVNSTGD